MSKTSDEKNLSLAWKSWKARQAERGAELGGRYERTPRPPQKPKTKAA